MRSRVQFAHEIDGDLPVSEKLYLEALDVCGSRRAGTGQGRGGGGGRLGRSATDRRAEEAACGVVGVQEPDGEAGGGGVESDEGVGLGLGLGVGSDMDLDIWSAYGRLLADDGVMQIRRAEVQMS